MFWNNAFASTKLWAQARNHGTPTASAQSLDADVILAAQVHSLGSIADQIVVATTNVGHLSLFVPAQLWTSIIPGT